MCLKKRWSATSSRGHEFFLWSCTWRFTLSADSKQETTETRQTILFMHLKLKALFLFVIIYKCLNVSNIKIYVFTVKSLLFFSPYLKNIFSDFVFFHLKLELFLRLELRALFCLNSFYFVIFFHIKSLFSDWLPVCVARSVLSSDEGVSLGTFVLSSDRKFSHSLWLTRFLCHLGVVTLGQCELYPQTGSSRSAKFRWGARFSPSSSFSSITAAFTLSGSKSLGSEVT